MPPCFASATKPSWRATHFGSRGTLEDPQRAQVALINTVIAKLDDGRMVRYLDIDPKFIEADGTLPRSIMPDLLHPNAHGYQIWADAMNPTLDEMMK